MLETNVHVTETTVGKTTYVVRAVCSPNARETLEQKLKRIMNRHISDAINCHENIAKDKLQCIETRGIIEIDKE